MTRLNFILLSFYLLQPSITIPEINKNGRPVFKGGHFKYQSSYLDAGGSEQIRTAVEAFAELCLTARPRNLLRWAKVVYSD